MAADIPIDAMEPVMPIPFVAALVASQLAMPVADRVPEFNYERGCRAAAAADTAVLAQSVSACEAEERGARQTLEQQWMQFKASDRKDCESMAALGESPSYVELLTCLQIARDTSRVPERSTFIKPNRR